MSWSDFHVHTTFSDGKNTAEEVILAAIEKGMDTVGFSDHSFTPFDTSYCTPEERLPLYRAEIARLKEKYADKIRILCGIEQDFYSVTGTSEYDYAIGSVHYIRAGDDYIPVDYTLQHLLDGAQKHFGGDMISLCEEYFRTVGLFAQRKDIAFVGHFDLITKFNEGGKLFDESDPRYVCAWQDAALRLIAAGLPFEVNMGAIAKGYRTAPYPAMPIAEFICSHGGKFLLSSDCHKAENLCFQFDKWTQVYL